MDESKFWELCLDKFSKKLTSQQINTWIKPLLLKTNDGQCSIHAPNQFVLEWVKDRFDKEIGLLAKEHLKIDNIAKYFYLIFVKNEHQYTHIDRGFLLISGKKMKLGYSVFNIVF